MRAPIFSVAAAALISLAGCTQAPPPAPDTRDADAKAIRDGEAAWNQDWAAKDLDKIMSHYADDANLEIPDSPILSGKDAIRGGLTELLKDPNLSLSFSVAQVEVAKGGDLGYSRGNYTLSVSDPKTRSR
jgi:ketosteroid isomerase-like protein